MRVGRFISSVMMTVILGLSSLAQPSDYPFSPETYPFIRYDINHIDLFGGNKPYFRFLEKLDTLLFEGKNHVNIVHYGGSHVQAGTFPREVMTRFQSIQPGLSLGTFYFPYQIAGTNTPRGYSTEGWGHWESCKNTERDRICPLGTSGISLSTSDTSAGFVISPNPIIENGDRIMIFLSDSSSYCLKATDSLSWVMKHEGSGYQVLEALRDSAQLAFQVVALDTLQRPISFYGLVTLPSEPGINYYAFGVNGANLPSFYSCEFLADQLRLIEPDLIILSIGINDANGKRFSQTRFQDNYETLIQEIKKAAPHAAILLTTNTDSYMYRRYLNRNALLVRESMAELSESYDCAVWDWFMVMGGLNSIRDWQNAGLAGYDRVHFTREGYSLSGDLLFEAILRSYEAYLNPEEASHD